MADPEGPYYPNLFVHPSQWDALVRAEFEVITSPDGTAQLSRHSPVATLSSSSPAFFSDPNPNTPVVTLKEAPWNLGEWIKAYKLPILASATSSTNQTTAPASTPSGTPITRTPAPATTSSTDLGWELGQYLSSSDSPIHKLHIVRDDTLISTVREHAEASINEGSPRPVVPNAREVFLLGQLQAAAAQNEQAASMTEHNYEVSKQAIMVTGLMHIINLVFSYPSALKTTSLNQLNMPRARTTRGVTDFELLLQGRTIAFIECKRDDVCKGEKLRLVVGVAGSETYNPQNRNVQKGLYISVPKNDPSSKLENNGGLQARDLQPFIQAFWTAHACKSRWGIIYNFNDYVLCRIDGPDKMSVSSVVQRENYPNLLMALIGLAALPHPTFDNFIDTQKHEIVVKKRNEERLANLRQSSQPSERSAKRIAIEVNEMTGATSSYGTPTERHPAPSS